MSHFVSREEDSGRYRTRADQEPWQITVWDTYPIGEGRGEGAQAGPTDNAYLGLSEVLWDVIGDGIKTSSKRQLGVGHSNRRLNLGGKLL